MEVRTDVMNNIAKQEKLNFIVQNLSTALLPVEGVRAFAVKLNEIYLDGFRHSYSSITGILLRQLEESGNSCFENLIQNLEMIEPALKLLECADVEVASKIGKLKDHISLEYIRQTQLMNTYSQKADDVKLQMEEAVEVYSKAEQLANQAVSDAQKIKMEVVTILGIFAAIVLSFMGGMSFTASTFNGIAQTSAYRVIFTAVVIGIVVFNTVSALLYIISKITDKPIYAKCKTEDCSCVEQCKPLARIRKRLPFMFWVNMIFITLLIFVLIGWLVGAYELADYLRNKIWNPIR